MDVNERRQRARAEAIQWWLRMEDGELSRQQSEEFVDWLRESAIHVAEMLSIGQLHTVLKEYPDWKRLPTEGAAEPNSPVIPFPSSSHAIGTEKPRRLRRWWWSAGAVLTAAAILTVWLSFLLRAEIIETERGERRDVLLADGSLIQVDPLTVLQVRLKAHGREIKLEQGRAVFRVAKDPDRPFTVLSGVTLVRAVGTQFGVERESKRTVVTVASGRVAVRTTGNQNEPTTVHPPEAGTDTVAEEVVLTAGQQVIVPRSGTAEPVKHVDSDRALAWADGRLEFENTPVAAVVEQFNRYNFVQLHVGDQQLGNRLVHGVFDVSEPESFISVIQTLTPVRIERKGQDITLYSGP